MRHQSYDSISFEAFKDHSNWVLEESPPSLTVEEVKALCNDLENISIQSTLDDIGMYLYCIIVFGCEYELLFY